jgi:hypothetical protein
VLQLNQCLRVRQDEVAAKVIEGEAIIINLASGNYYSLAKTGGLIWEMIQDGCTLEHAIAAVVSRYDVVRERAETDVQSLVAQLLDENLIEISNNGGPVSESRGPVADRTAYVAPHLNIYREMGDLLALDPPVPGLGDVAWKDEEPSR